MTLAAVVAGEDWYIAGLVLAAALVVVIIWRIVRSDTRLRRVRFGVFYEAEHEPRDDEPEG